MWLFWKAVGQLIIFDFYLIRNDFAALYRRVQRCPVGGDAARTLTIEEICVAVKYACICYPRRSLCLQRSAATTCLLRQHGLRAQLVIGARKLPFKAHAWVEVDGQIVNDKPYISETYVVLDRC